MGTFLLRACCLFFLYFAGCSSPQSSSVRDWAADTGKLKILSTTAMIDDLVGRIGGDRVDHQVLIQGQIDPHSYELVKGDSEKFAFANLIFYNGLGLEHGASLHYQLREHPRAIPVGEVILQRHPAEVIHVGNQVDPHVWMDISLWAEAISPILSGLIALDPSGKDEYEQRAASLRSHMQEVHDSLFAKIQEIPEEKRYIVTSHDAFNYFTRAYLATDKERVDGSWTKRFDAPEGLAPEGQLGSADIQQVIEYLIAHRVSVVFPESNVSRDSLQKVVHACQRKGIKITLWPQTLYGDSMGPPGSGADTYLGMMEYDASVMCRAWQNE